MMTSKLEEIIELTESSIKTFPYGTQFQINGNSFNPRRYAAICLQNKSVLKVCDEIIRIRKAHIKESVFHNLRTAFKLEKDWLDGISSTVDDLKVGEYLDQAMYLQGHLDEYEDRCIEISAKYPDDKICPIHNAELTDDKVNYVSYHKPCPQENCGYYAIQYYYGGG